MTSQILVVGYCGFGNAGDDALGIATVNQLQALTKSADISVTTGSHSLFADETARAVPFTLRTIFREMYAADQVVLTGGSHFHDRYAQFIDGFKIFVFYLLLVLSARTLRKDVHLLGHGIGPLRNPVFRIFTALIVAISTDVTVRDPPSKAVIKGRWTNVELAFDIAILLDETIVPDQESDSEVVLGVSVTPAFAKFFNKPDRDDALIANLSAAINKIGRNSNIEEVRIFVFHTGEFNDDLSLSEHLENKIETLDTQIVRYRDDPIKFIAEIGESDVFVGMKYHSLVFAYLNQIPTAGISYHPKCEWFRDYVGYNHESTIDMKDAIDGSVTERLVSRLIDESDLFRPDMSVDEAKSLAEHNFDGLTHYHE